MDNKPPVLDATVVDLFDEWAAKDPGRIAAEWQGETLTYGELRNASLHMSKALLAANVQPLAKVPVLTQMSLEMLPAVIGILRVRACYAPMDVAMWSTSRVEAALSQVASPMAVVTAACPGLQLPVLTVNFQKEWLHAPLEGADELCQRLDAIREGFRADDLAWTIFTSGSTGVPKGVMIYHRAIHAITVLDHTQDLEDAAAEGIRCLLAFSIAFDGCAAVVWTTLTKGGTLGMASPSNFPEVAATCELLHLTPSMLAIMDPSGPYQRVRYIFLGAEAPKLDVVRQWITPTRKVYNTYGPSETTCIISFGELKPDEEPPFGNLIPGVRVVLVDENLQERDYGEVMISGAGLAAGYLNNPGMTAKKFIQWDGRRFYRTGDLARRLEDGQFVWAGRADNLVKNRGFLINLETEVEPAMASFPPVRRAISVKWRDRLIGFVQPAAVDVSELREFMAKRFDPFVIPDGIVAMDGFPLNTNGKTDRLALQAHMDERSADDNDVSLAQNGQALSPYDALRMAFSVCLQVPFRELNEDSSFTRLGGNSLAAIRLSGILRKYGKVATVVQILKLDTIKSLESVLVSLSEPDQHDKIDNNSAMPMTDFQKSMLVRSLANPLLYALIGITRYTGDPVSTPTPGELHKAFVRAVSAHSIFKTRFDLTNFTFSDLDQRELAWHDVIAEEADFEGACVAAEEQAWRDLHRLDRADLEIPYFRITCISVPDRKALAFVSCMHHVLTDVFSSALLMGDVERVLAGKDVAPGPRIRDFVEFWHDYKQQNLQRATAFFESMVQPLPATSVLKLPAPSLQPRADTFSLARLESPTTVTRSALASRANNSGITTSTIVCAAWSLFLAKISGWDRVGFSISLSGRMIPWPAVEDIVGPLTTRAPFSTAVPSKTTVQEWLAKVNQLNLDMLEFDGLMHSLPESLMQDPRTKSTIVLCLLDMPQGSSDWSHKEKQEHHFSMLWHVYEDAEVVKTEVDIQLREVDRKWAEEMRVVPGRMLDGLINATEDTLVGDLLQ
ncbi:hypothetical protein LRP88_01732 [Fusarium phalaenopsidis]